MKQNPTTIRVRLNTKNKLDSLKLNSKETYDDVLKRLIYLMEDDD